MNRAMIRFCAYATAVCAASALFAQDDSSSGEAGGDSLSGVDPALVKAASKPAPKYFHELVRLLSAEADVSVRLPRQDAFKEAVVGKFYPNGSAFRVSGGSAEFEFGNEASLKVAADSEFSLAEAEFGARARTVIPIRGVYTVSLPRTMPTGLFFVAYPNFTVKDLAGESRHELMPSGDGDEAVVHVITGMLAIDGPHYKIGRMGAADRIRIRTTGDKLFTSLRGEAGDYKVTLDQGVSTYRDPVSGEIKKQERSLDFSLTPQCAIKIFRKRSAVGGRMAVSVMTFDPAGEMRNRFTFAEGTASVNFGEEVVRIQDISFKTDGGKPSKKGGAKADRSNGDSGDQQSSAESSSAKPDSGDASSEGGGESSGGGFGDN